MSVYNRQKAEFSHYRLIFFYLPENVQLN